MKGKLWQLPQNALEEDMMTAESATLKLENQKNGWKAACICHQEVNREYGQCLVRALAQQVPHLWQHNKANNKSFLCSCTKRRRKNICVQGM